MDALIPGTLEFRLEYAPGCATPIVVKRTPGGLAVLASAELARGTKYCGNFTVANKRYSNWSEGVIWIQLRYELKYTFLQHNNLT